MKIIKLLNIPEKYRITTRHEYSNKLKEKIFKGKNVAYSNEVKQIDLVASIKPGIGNVVASRTDNIRYDELEIFHIIITDVQHLHRIFEPFYKEIRYPCLLIIQYKDRYMLSACKFSAGKLDYNANVEKHMVFSHWLFPENMSTKAEEFIDSINSTISDEGELQVLYGNIFNLIVNFQISGITKSHVDRLLKDMIGKSINSSSFWEKFTPYKKHDLVGSGKAAKYAKRGKSYKYSYDREDLWHGFMSEESIRRTIEGRKYRDIDDLIYDIDLKLDQNEGSNYYPIFNDDDFKESNVIDNYIYDGTELNPYESTEERLFTEFCAANARPLFEELSTEYETTEDEWLHMYIAACNNYAILLFNKRITIKATEEIKSSFWYKFYDDRMDYIFDIGELRYCIEDEYSCKSDKSEEHS